MQVCLEHRFGRLRQRPARRDTLSIVGYGPSLLQTNMYIEHPFMTLSGAHDFMLDRGERPDYHADCDPRQHKAGFVRSPCADTTYLMASCCHPATWDHLKRQHALVWHADTGPEARAWLEENAPGEWSMRPGPSIGIAALGLARVLGFSKVRLFGYDSCFVEEQLRAGPSDAPYTHEPRQVLTVNGETYLTTENMRLQAEAFLGAVEGLQYEIVGEGLLKAMVNERKAA